MEKILDGNRNDFKWYMFFLLYSSQRLLPFFSEMNVPVRSEEIQDCAREFIRQYQASSGDQAWMEGMVQGAFQCIAEVTSAETALELLTWVKRDFHFSDDCDLTSISWIILFRNPSIDRDAQLGALGFPQESLLILDREISTYLGNYSRSLEERLEKVDEQPPQGWDAYVYELYQGGSSDLSPTDTLLSLIETYRFTQLWSKLRGLLSRSDFETLLHWAQSVRGNRPVVMPEC